MGPIGDDAIVRRPCLLVRGAGPVEQRLKTTLAGQEAFVDRLFIDGRVVAGTFGDKAGVEPKSSFKRGSEEIWLGTLQSRPDENNYSDEEEAETLKRAID